VDWSGLVYPYVADFFETLEERLRRLVQSSNFFLWTLVSWAVTVSSWVVMATML